MNKDGWMPECHLATVTTFGVRKLAYGKRSHGTKFPPAASRAHVSILIFLPFYWHQMSNWSDHRKITCWTHKSMIGTLLLVWLHWNNWRWVTNYWYYCQQGVIKMVYLFGALLNHPSLCTALCELSYTLHGMHTMGFVQIDSIFFLQMGQQKGENSKKRVSILLHYFSDSCLM